MAAPTERAQKQSLVLPQKGTRAEALALILRPLQHGDGFRHGALGAPGYGKTHHIRELIKQLIAWNVVDLVVTHDVKGATAEFEGTEVAYVGDIRGQIAAIENTRHVVLRGDPQRDQPCAAEDAATHAKQLARDGLRVVLNVAELDECLSEGGRSFEAPSVRWFSSQGRKLGASLTWTTQQPKRTPDEIFDQSTSISYFHLDARSSNYLGNTLMLDDRMVEILPRLAHGEYVLGIPGAEWNGHVYRD